MSKFENGTPAPNTAKPKSKASAAIITVVVCLILAASSIFISLLHPSNDFDFIPSLIGLGETHYSDMEYERPDDEIIIKNMDELIIMISDNKSFTEQSRLFTQINDDIINYRTMMSLAEIRYYTDTTDEFYKTENELLQLEYVEIYDKTGELLDTIEASSFKANYERTFFGLGYFNDWTPMDKSDAAAELLKKEQELIAKYEDAISNAFVTFEGKDISMPSEEFYSLDAEDRSVAVDLYIKKYNEELGGIYAELIATRFKIAEELDTDYVSYAYDALGRDFSPDEANVYIDSLAEKLLPTFSKYESDTSLLMTPTDTVTSFYHLSLAASRMGGSIEDAFDYMVKYGLYEVAASDKKQSLSFETFLEKYYSPFLFVSSTGTANDFLTYAHEFGHFTDDYVNLGFGITIDSAEIASQSMAYIMPLYSNGMGDISGEELLKQNISSTFEMYYSSIFVHKFETAVYALDPDEISLSKLNELAFHIATELGFDDATAESISLSWFEYQHIYIAPMYYSAYPISNDVALQVLDAELADPGKGGIKAFENAITKDSAKTFAENITSAGFKSPFEEGRADALANLIDGIFFPEVEENMNEEGSAESLDIAA